MSGHLLCFFFHLSFFINLPPLHFLFFFVSNLFFEDLPPSTLSCILWKLKSAWFQHLFICLTYQLSAPIAWPLCHQGSAFVPVAPVSDPQLGAPSPQVPLTATLLLVLSYHNFINSIYEVWISNIQLGPQLSDHTMGQEAAAYSLPYVLIPLLFNHNRNHVSTEQDEKPTMEKGYLPLENCCCTMEAYAEFARCSYGKSTLRRVSL